MKFREKLPARPEVEAFHWRGANWNALRIWLDEHLDPEFCLGGGNRRVMRDLLTHALLVRDTDDRVFSVVAGCYLVIDGDPFRHLKVCSEEVFLELYELAAS